MRIKLKNEMFNILINEVEDAESLLIGKKELEDGMIELEISDIDELQLLINDEIVYRGLNNQDTVNNFGKKLYELYDEILYQKHSNEE